MKFSQILSNTVAYLQQFLNPPMDDAEFENYTNLLTSIVETRLKEESTIPRNGHEIKDWVAKNYLDIEEEVENPHVGTIAYAEEEEEDFEPISSKKEKRLSTMLYDFFEYCGDDEDYENEFENVAQYVSNFIKKHISENLSPKIFHKCINRALKQAKEDLWWDRRQTMRVNKLARFLKEMVVFL